ncbi:MAG: FAD-binding protein [Polyangiaceae bacterium]
MKTVVVAGAGVAGTAAALTAARGGARVVLLDGGTGATTLSTGAIDDAPWGRAAVAVTPVSPAARAVLDALAGYAVPAAGARLATTAGILRPARGLDLALLDLAPLAGRRIGVVQCDRPGWDAAVLARAWADAGDRGDAFAPLDAAVLRHVDERLIPATDFAARHDDEGRLAWLAERLREALAGAGAGFDALILPPSLGVETAKAQALSALVGVPCGEAAGLPGGPSGLRFERARDRALAAAGVIRMEARVAAVVRHGDRWRVALEGDEPAMEAVAVVLASGGLVGGGLEYSPAEAMPAGVLPPASRPPFRLAFDVPAATLGAHGRPLDLPGSLFGIPPESLAWPFAPDAAMERAGVLVDADGRAAAGLYAAGETVADAPRTWLRALESGARAGAAAARDAIALDGVSATASDRSPSASATPASRP